MTQEEKDILTVKMLDAPDSLSDEELDMILLDDDLRDIHEISAAIRGACMPEPQIDVAREWRLFRHRILPKPSPRRWLMRVAAIFLGVVIGTGIIVKVIDLLLMPEEQPVIAETVRSAVRDHVKTGNGESPTIVDEDVAPDVPEKCMPAVAKRHSAAEKIDNDTDFDVDEYLRLQQEKIDRDMALINAEIYLDQCDAIQEFMEYIDGNADMADYADAEIIFE